MTAPLLSEDARQASLKPGGFGGSTGGAYDLTHPCGVVDGFFVRALS